MSSVIPVTIWSHTGITVSRLDEALTFYRDVLGFRLLYEDVEDGWTRLGLSLGEHVLELFSPHPAGAAGEAVDPYYPAEYGRPKIALSVADIDLAHERASAAGVPVLCDVVTTPASRFFFVTDPDGTHIQLQQFNSGRARLADMFADPAPAGS